MLARLVRASQLDRSGRVVASVFASPELRRVELAFAGFNAAEWAVWIAMLVFAYDQGGATTAGLVALVQLAPAALAAPFTSALADRKGPARVLAAGYAAQALALAATAAALLAGAPPLVAYALAAVAATLVTVTRPTQSALVPALARTPEELTAANVVSGWIESVSMLAAPALAGVLLGVGSPGLVFAVMAIAAAGSAVLVGPLARREPGLPVPAEQLSPLRATAGAFRRLAREPSSRTLVGLLGAQSIVVGALDVLFVVLAIGVLGLGESGAGYLNAAFGAGGVLGIAATAALVGRRHLVPPLLVGAGAWSLALVALGARASVVGAFLLLGVAGAGRTLLDVAGRTLLQRTAPTDVLARAFGLVESLSMAGLALGSLLTPALVAVGGASAALVGVALVLPLVIVMTARRLLAADSAARVPVVEVSLLRSNAIFAPLPPPALEALAKSLTPVDLEAGDVVISQGDAGDRFYVISDGELEVAVDGEPVAVRRRGEGVGEVALLHDVARTATVRARTPAHLFALGREPFLAAVTGHAPALDSAIRLAEEHLAVPPQV